MVSLFKTNVGRLRILGFLEGVSLLLLLFIAVPIKYGANDPTYTKWLGSIHGALFVLFILNTLSVAIEQKWAFKKTTWKVILASFIPFGSFYIDRKILSKI